MKARKPVHTAVSAAVLILLFGGVAFLWYVSSVERNIKRSELPVISETIVVTDFASCVAAGNPVLESFPEQCRHDNETFTNNPESILLKEELVPEEWVNQGGVDGGYVVFGFNDGLGGDDSLPSCQFAASSTFPKKGDETADSLKQDLIERLRIDKNYETEQTSETTKVIFVNGQDQSFTFYNLRSHITGEEGSTMNWLVGYVVGKTSYISLETACNNGPVPEIQELLSALELRIK